MLYRTGVPSSEGIGLTVNGVTPGYIATDMLATIRQKVLNRLRHQMPAGRLGRQDEIARVVSFLAGGRAFVRHRTDLGRQRRPRHVR